MLSLLSPRRPTRLALLPCLVLLSAHACLPAAAAPRAIPAGTPCYVDLNRVLTEYRKSAAFQRYGQRLREQTRIYGEEMETLAQFRYLGEAERKEALAIRAKPRPSERETARLEELKKKSESVDNEAVILSQKPEPTDAEKARIQELATLRATALQTLAKEENDRRDLLRKLESEMLGEVEAELLKLVERVARELKLPYIYERRAILHGGIDLTEDVLKRVPK